MAENLEIYYAVLKSLTEYSVVWFAVNNSHTHFSLLLWEKYR